MAVICKVCFLSILFKSNIRANIFSWENGWSKKESEGEAYKHTMQTAFLNDSRGLIPGGLGLQPIKDWSTTKIIRIGNRIVLQENQQKKERKKDQFLSNNFIIL